MRTLSIEKMERTEGGDFLNALGCAAGIGLVVVAVTETSTGIGSVAGLMHFVVGVESIYDYCGKALD